MTAKKWLKWEYWPASFFYVPILPYYMYLAIKARHPVFFTAANPGLEAGGGGFESKYKSMLLIPKKWRPDTYFVPKDSNLNDIIQILLVNEIEYPFILKPDVGFRGLLVSKIRNPIDLKSYMEANTVDLILQTFVKGDNEYGVFYHRRPGQENGKVTSLTQKVYLHVIGDGKLTIEQLMIKDSNFRFFIDQAKVYHGTAYMSIVPSKGERVVLSHIGNHSKGATFLNINEQITAQLEQRIDLINKEIKGWYYGRLDIKVPDMRSLLDGKDISIIEVNGIISEPTHIYDTNEYNYFTAVREIVRHWDIIYQVSKESRKNGAKYYGTINMIKKIIEVIKTKKEMEQMSL